MLKRWYPESGAFHPSTLLASMSASSPDRPSPSGGRRNSRTSWLTFHCWASPNNCNKNLKLISTALVTVIYQYLWPQESNSLAGQASVTCPLLIQKEVVSPAPTTWSRTLGHARRRTDSFLEGDWELGVKNNSSPTLCLPCLWALELWHLFFSPRSSKFPSLQLNRQFAKSFKNE